MFYPYSIMFISILILSVFFQISATSWLSIWMGLEMNMMVIIPMLVNMKNMMLNESSMKYFIVQVFGSILLLLGCFMSSFYKMQLFYFMSLNMNLTFIGILLKLGAAPCHFWFPIVLDGLSWFGVFMMMTIQKLGLLLIMSYFMFQMLLILIISTLNSLVGGIGGLNQTSMRKIMAYSSIGHLGWLILSIKLVEKIWIMYFSFYTFMSSLFTIFFYFKKINFISQLYKTLIMSEMILIMLSFMSLGGLPPFSGFFPKWMILLSLMNDSLFFVSLLMLIGTLVSLYFYIRMTYISLMFSLELMVYNKKFENLFTVKMISLLMMITLFIIPLGMMIY